MMIKNELQAIELFPLNLEQIKLSGVLLGARQNKSFQLSAQQIRFLELMQKGCSIAGISEDFLKNGKLLSFNQLKELLHFLFAEKMIKNLSMAAYFDDSERKISTQAHSDASFIDQFFKTDSSALDISNKIRQMPFFRSLAPDIVDLFLAHHKVIECPAGIKVCEAGVLQRSLLCVVEGSLSVFTSDSKGEKKRIIELWPESVFGETGFFLGQPRTADVMTNSKCVIAKFKYIPEIFDHLIQKEKAQALQKRIWLIHALLSSPMFKDLPDDCFDSIIYSGQLKSVKIQTTIFSEGQRADRFYILIQGKLNVLQNQKIIRNLKQGDCFGEVALMLTGGLRTASVVCETDCLLLEISAQKFYQLLGENLFLACQFEKLSIERVQADQKR